MARIRTIKPEFWTSESVVECSCSARLLLIGMLNFADDYGNLVNSPKRLKMQIFPADIIDTAPLLDELIKHGLVIQYAVDGEKYLNIKGFRKHQVINKPSKSKIPLPSFDKNTDVVVDEECLSATVVVDEECFTEGNGREGINTNNNTRASFEKIETQGEYVAKPVRELFNMTLDWKPNQQTFAAITMRNGLSAEYSDDRLAGFVSYWQAEPIELTQGQWENKFATYLKRPVLAPKEPKPKASPRNQQPQHDEYIQPPLYVPKPKVENPATPEQIKEIMDEMRRKIAGGE